MLLFKNIGKYIIIINRLTAINIAINDFEIMPPEVKKIPRESYNTYRSNNTYVYLFQYLIFTITQDNT